MPVASAGAPFRQTIRRSGRRQSPPGHDHRRQWSTHRQREVNRGWGTPVASEVRDRFTEAAGAPPDVPARTHRWRPARTDLRPDRHRRHVALRRRPDPQAGVRAANRRGLRHLRPPRRGADRPPRRRPGPLAHGAVPRAHAGVQGRRPAARGQAVRPRAGPARRAGHHRGGHLGRHRLGGHRGVPRPRLPRHLRAAPARPRLGGAAPPDDHGALRERPQHRPRRQLRRLPGPGEGHVRRRGLPRPAPAGGGELNQLRQGDGPDRLLRGGGAGARRHGGRPAG